MELQSNYPRKETLSHKLQSFFQLEYNIYNHAHLLKKKEPAKQINFLDKSENEYSIVFKLDGELQGYAICSTYLINKHADLKSLFSESMNIILGNFLTKLEQETGIMSLISTNKEIPSRRLFLSKASKQFNEVNLLESYNLLVSMETHICNIQIIANTTKTIEV